MTQPWFYIKIKRNYSPSEFSEVVERILSRCLRRRWDNVVLDIAGIDMLESMHLSIIIRWLRSLKSLGGNLVLSGLNEDIQTILSATRLKEVCKVYRDEAEFRQINPEAKIFIQDGETGKIFQKDSEQKSQSRAVAKAAKPVNPPPLKPGNSGTA